MANITLPNLNIDSSYNDSNKIIILNPAERIIMLPDVKGVGDTHDEVTLTGENYISINGQELTANKINLAHHVTGVLPAANGGFKPSSLQDVTEEGATTDVFTIFSGGVSSSNSNTTRYGKDAARRATGSNWTAIGWSAGYSATDATYWTAIGRSAGYGNRTGDSWTAIGSTAGAQNTTSDHWTAVGSAAGANNNSGGSWCALGHQAGRFLVSGQPATTFTRCNYIGKDTRVSTNGVTNEHVFGYGAQGKGSNTISLGNYAITGVYSDGSYISSNTSPLGSAPGGVNAASGHVLTADGNGGSSWETGGGGGTVGTLQEVTDQGATTTNPITIKGSQHDLILMKTIFDVGAIELADNAGNIGTSINGGGGANFSGRVTVGEFQMMNGAQNGYVLTSNAQGVGTWQAAGGGGTVGTLQEVTEAGSSTSVGVRLMGQNTSSIASSSSERFGTGTLENLITMPTNLINTAFGNSALKSCTTGNNNCAFGQSALSRCNSRYNHAFGNSALASLTSGSYNHAFGYQALVNNSTGGYNCAMGYRALRFCNSNYNVAIGHNALSTLSVGSNCVAVGNDALNRIKTNSGSTAIGNAAGNNQGGRNCTFLGYNAGYSSGNVSYNNSVAIGFQSAITKSNQIVIGNKNITETLSYGRRIIKIDSNSAFGLSIQNQTSGDNLINLNSLSDTGQIEIYNNNTSDIGVSLSGTGTGEFKGAVTAAAINTETAKFSNLPISSSGLAAGTLWNDGGTVKIA